MDTTQTKPSSAQDLSRVLSPRSIAVIGASRKEGSVGQAVFHNLLQNNFQGVLYPVNPQAHSLNGVKTYRTLSEIEDSIDLAILIVPNVVVPSVLKECAAKGIPGAIVISAGFKEVGGKGAELEDEVKRIAEESGIALIGPNCLGVINTDPAVRMNASFAATMPKTGNIAFVSQSGALCTAVLDYAKAEGIGFSKFVSLGNKAATNELDFLRALADDPQTDVILMYVEDISNGAEFIRIASHITGDQAKPKPILAIKSGRTAEGAKAASSHTGSLAGSDEVYDAVFMQSGVMRVETVQELFDFGVAFSSQPLPKGNRIGIVTNAGGPGIMATDAVIRYGLKLASFEESTKAALRSVLPATASVGNPVDVIGDARHDRFQAAIAEVVKDPNVDGLIVILTPQAMTDIKETGEVVANVAKKMQAEPWMAKPILASFMGIVDVSEGLRILEGAGVPHYTFPEAAARAMARMFDYRKKWLDRPRTQPTHFPVQRERAQRVIDRVRNEGRTYLPEHDALEVFHAYGMPVLANRLVTSEEAAIAAAREIGLPVAVKINSPAIVHKLDAGGVVIGVDNEAGVARAYRSVMKNAEALVGREKILGVEIQKMAEKGTEVFLGCKRDPNFGPVIVFGLGGTFVEVFKDVSFRVAPLKSHSINVMIDTIKASKMLHGYRNTPKADIPRIAECLGRLSQLVIDFPEIQELDINPLIVYPEGRGAQVADGRILLSDGRAADRRDGAAE